MGHCTGMLSSLSCHVLLTTGKGCPSVRLHARSEAHALQGCCLPNSCTNTVNSPDVMEALGMYSLNDLLWFTCSLVISGISML